jgi:DNA polymerase-3 subunit gamma/tau
MAWQSLYRRYRPRRFAEVVGQDHVVNALRNAVRDGRVGHAYLFSGPRGTGKTTSARLLAKALNCENLVDGEPCLVCPSCVSIEAGTSYDLHELDAASNNGVDAMRDLIARAALGTPGRTKVYILDEVHMLSAGAANALLKTLEEPPEHVVFALATTDPHKVLPTIRSRTQHFELHLLPADALEAHVRWIVADAGLAVDDEIIAHVLRAGGGSARDTLSALDGVVAAGGIDDRGEDADALLAALLERDPGAVLAAVHEAVVAGRDPRVLGEGIVGRLRDAFLASLGVGLDHLPEGDRARTTELARHADRPFLTRALELLGDALVAMRQAADPRITLETALVRLADVEADTSNAALLERIERLERTLAAGGAGSGRVEASAPSRPVGRPAHDPGPVPESEPAATREGSGPAEEARRKLAERRPAPAPQGTAPPAAAPAPQPTAPPPEPEARGAVATEVPPAGDLPSRDELTLAWGDTVLGSLTGPARARFAAGRFVGVEGGAALFALPNEVHRDRCESVRGDVERALGVHFGRPVPLRLVVDGSATVPAPEAAPKVADVEEIVDLDELVDAPAEPVRTPLDRVTEAFPGAEVLEEEPR